MKTKAFIKNPCPVMEYREAYAWPLTSPTTVYTGARRTLDSPAATTSTSNLRLTTEFNSLELVIRKDIDKCSCKSFVAFENETYHVTGYDSIGDWEVLVLLNRRLSSQQQADQAVVATDDNARQSSTATTENKEKLNNAIEKPLLKASTSNASIPESIDGGDGDDPARLLAQAATTHSPVASLGDVFTTLHHHHGSDGNDNRTSSSSFLRRSLDTIPNGDDAVSNMASAAVPSAARTTTAASQTTKRQQQPLTMIILRNVTTNQEYRASLADTRPLAPMLSLLPETNSANTTDETRILLWLGSADTNYLQLWYPLRKRRTRGDGDNDAVGRLVCCKDVSLLFDAPLSNAFDMDSPIMAINVICLKHEHGKHLLDTNEEATSSTEPVDVVTDSAATSNDDNQDQNAATFCLTMASQDGTIRMVTFACQAKHAAAAAAAEDCDESHVPFTFSNVAHHCVTVDGPIVCLHAVQRSDHKVHLVVGSLCGYVCELFMTCSASTTDVQDNDTLNVSYTWSDPEMVAEGFYCQRSKSEDSVLAVHAHENFVYIGTLSGRCCVFEGQGRTSDHDGSGGTHNDNASTLYTLVWECRLPYSVHDIVALDAQRFIVTTRRSVHLFTGTRLAVQYDVDLALERLRLLMKKHGLVVDPCPAKESVSIQAEIVEDQSELEETNGRILEDGTGSTDDSQ
ncbi:hypothetical protein MPSEU_000032700 [Mayamaea pseudoterrestris]|nr:hypothetical protein MPSEU_000032700 [Mayamaea pseudoterrestris]